MGQIRFDFVDREASSAYCVKLASKMSIFAKDEIAHLLSFKYLLHEFDREKIAEIGRLVADPSNAIVFLSSKEISPSLFDSEEKWFRIKYNKHKIPSDHC
jgi:secreted Zn-dependent insulinase-like peptidase